MRDPAAPPTWLLIMVGLAWMFALGVWFERNRFGGTHTLTSERDELRLQVDELTATVDELVNEGALLRGEVDTRRQAAMLQHPSAVTPRDLHLRVVAGGIR